MGSDFLSKQALDLEEEKIFYAKEEGSRVEPFSVLDYFLIWDYEVCLLVFEFVRGCKDVLVLYLFLDGDR